MSPLAKKQFIKSANALSKEQPLFATLKGKYGFPSDFARPPGFATLVLIILEQQVSLASAQAVFDKLLAAEPQLTPDTFLQWTDEELLGFGYSRQKRRYTRLLCEAILAGDFDFAALQNMPDQEAQEYLIRLKGIGPWTADVYLLMAESRADFFPAGDLALQISYKEQLQLEDKPSSAALAELAMAWSPYRSLAAKWLWHAYLKERAG